jgi:hypothetical protein
MSRFTKLLELIKEDSPDGAESVLTSGYEEGFDITIEEKKIVFVTESFTIEFFPDGTFDVYENDILIEE